MFLLKKKNFLNQLKSPLLDEFLRVTQGLHILVLIKYNTVSIQYYWLPYEFGLYKYLLEIDAKIENISFIRLQIGGMAYHLSKHLDVLKVQC